MAPRTWGAGRCLPGQFFIMSRRMAVVPRFGSLLDERTGRERTVEQARFLHKIGDSI